MPTTLRIKRRSASGASGAPSALKNGELAYSEKDKILYYGFGDDGSGNATTIPSIAGEGAYVKTDASNIDAKNANTVLAGPSTGAAAAPTFRVLVANDIPTLTAAKISDFDTQVRTSRLDQMAPPTASVSLNNQKITGLAAPSSDTDAATKSYVDMSIQGLDPKASVKAATTANVTLSGAQTIDGVSLIAGDRVLVKDQSSAPANGIYVVAAGAWARSTDMDEWAEVPGAYVFVEQGTINGDIGYLCTADAGGTLGTTAIAWSQFTGAGNISAGDGLTQVGSTLNVASTGGGSLTITADSVNLTSDIVTANTYKSVTVDTYGRVTAGTNPTTLSGYGITDAQSLDATLSALAGVTVAANQVIYATGADAFATTSLTSFGRSLIDDADATAARTTLSLGTIATQAANNVSITGGTIDGVTIDGGTY
jgi:hypothetical protein